MPSVFVMRRSSVVPLADTFNRTNSSTTLNPPSDAGPAWSVDSGGVYGISGNTAVLISGTGDPMATRDPGDYTTMTYSLTVQRNSGSMQVVFGYTDNANHYLVNVDTSGTMSLRRVIAGVSTTVATASLPFWFGEVHTVTVTHNRSTGAITAAWDGVTKITYTDGSPLPGTRCGFEAVAGYVDDFTVTPA